jgi:tyrosyl-tRNA synthetase
MPAISEDLTARGLVNQVTDEALLAQLDQGGVSLYAGFDPTADSLHAGNLLQLCTLRRIQLAGNRPIVVAGGATGMIGDPGGRSDERSLLDAQTLQANLAATQIQLAQFLDFSPERGASQAILVNNADWLGEVKLLDFLRDTGKHFTVNQMVAKESVKSRLERPDQGISYTEFSYMLLQAYDFAQLYERYGCTAQIGGSDQWGNITMGAELVRKVHGAQAFGLTTPLVTNADGTKFGKSAGNAGRIWLDRNKTSPFGFYQFFINTDDAMVGIYLRFFSFLSLEAISELEAETAEKPQRRSAHKALAAAMVELVHGPEDLARVERATAALFGGSLASLDEATLAAVVQDVPSSSKHLSWLGSAPSLLDALVDTGLVASKSEARRTVEQNGAFVNDAVREGLEASLSSDDLLFGRFIVLRKGKRAYHVIECVAG